LADGRILGGQEAIMTDFLPAGAGQTHNVLGMRHVNKLIPNDDGPLVIELTIPPGCGAPPHRHESGTESSYVLSGAVTFSADGAERVARAGDFQHLPARGAHALRNDGAEDARALVIVTPGAEALRFFTEVDAAMQRGGPTLDAITAMAERNGL